MTDQAAIKVFLRFPSHMTDQPITYRLVKDYDIEFNILHAEIQPGKIGTLTAELKGKKKNLEAAVKYIEKLDIHCRIFNRNIIWHEEQCVHCGYCTAVCPSRALYMEGDAWELQFDRSKCLMCELCVETCPTSAIDVHFFED